MPSVNKATNLNPNSAEHYPYAVAVVIGRFQIFHYGHLAMLQQALRTGQQVVVVIGSANQARSAINPFSWQERQQMILACLTPAEQQRLLFVAVRDYYHMQRWQQAVQHQVTDCLQQATIAASDKQIALVGYFKDQTSSYLNQFPNWHFISTAAAINTDGSHKSSTALRRIYFSTATTTALSATALADLVPPGCLSFLTAWRNSATFRSVQQYWHNWQQLSAQPANNPSQSALYLLVECAGRYLIQPKSSLLSSASLGLPSRTTWQPPSAADAMEFLTQCLPQLNPPTTARLLDHYDHPQRVLGRTEQAWLYYSSITAAGSNLTDNATAPLIWLSRAQISAQPAAFIDDNFNLLIQSFSRIDSNN